VVRLIVLTVSSILALSTLPVHAQTTGDVLRDIGRQMNGEPVHRDDYWREHERRRAHWHEQHRLDADQRALDARRRALHDERRYNEESGFYGR
jgi:hypothetical protein